MAVSQSRGLRRRSNRLALSLVKTWRKAAGQDFDTAFASAMPDLFAALDDAQLQTATDAMRSTPLVMVGFDGSVAKPGYSADPRQWVGVDGGGYDTLDSMWGAVTAGKQAVKAGASIDVALNRVEMILVLRSKTLLADTQRSVASVSAHSRDPYASYVRGLTPPSCGRCVILAGKPSGSIPFQRHPQCDCTALYAHNIPQGAYSNPNEYLESLDDDALAHTLGGPSNAQAWKDGADLNQLVNARRGGIRSAQFYDRTIKYTTEGTTRRGFASHRMIDSGYANDFIKQGGRYTRVGRPRLMPETIYQIAGNDHERAVTMLRKYGWIF